MKRINRVGEIHGLLTVIEFAGISDKGKKQSMWLCKCNCGNTIIVKNEQLASKKTRSCGCLLKKITAENSKNALEKRMKTDLIEGTSIRAISNSKLLKNNRSGTTGVCWDKNKNKWIAQIWFKGKNYKLGYFKDKDEAIKARKGAEEKLFEQFLKWYKEKYEK